MSLRELERAIGNLVTAQAIGKYERDEDMPSPAVLSSLASALHVSEDYLLAAGELTLDGVEFRKKAIASKREESFVEGQVVQLLSRYLAIERVLRLPSLDWDRPREAPYPVHETAQAENAARALRMHWGLGIDPIPKLSELLEERGIKILSVPLTNIDGLTAKVAHGGGAALPVIVVKQGAWAERKRFTLAHELGHMVMDIQGSADAEKSAHRFSGAFLMPAEALWREIGRHRTSMSLGELLRLKQLFGASFQAIVFRCRDLGIIGAATLRQLFQTFSARGWRSPPYEEPGRMPPEQEEPRRMERLCFRALSEGAIMEAQASDILGISVRELAKRMEQPEPQQR
jgi:Zn-dependent peptidase ImmA (M78 family)/transcriptional regulator with XRE-family HTH domain